MENLQFTIYKSDIHTHGLIIIVSMFHCITVIVFLYSIDAAVVQDIRDLFAKTVQLILT